MTGLKLLGDKTAPSPLVFRLSQSALNRVRTPVYLERRTLVYYNENRLYQVYENGVWLSSHEYNAQGQRVNKTTANGSMILYQYDLAGHLISELHYDDTRVRDYVWLNNTLLAQIEADGSVHYLHSDHLDTPRAATDADSTVVWRWESEAFGGTGTVCRRNNQYDRRCVYFKYRAELRRGYNT